jgi:hypothetical protein
LAAIFLPGIDIWNVGVFFAALAKSSAKLKNLGKHDILMAMLALIHTNI